MFVLETIAALPAGADRTAGLVAWIQELYEGRGVPVLVGGAAAELYTRGAYVTGDLDFVGTVPLAVRTKLEQAGFERHGRHWIHEALQIFLEFPSDDLAEGESAARLTVGRSTVLLIGLEEILIDRLSAWEFWASEVDAATAFQLWRARQTELDPSRLARLARAARVTDALERLQLFARGLGGREPSPDELASWSRRAE